MIRAHNIADGQRGHGDRFPYRIISSPNDSTGLLGAAHSVVAAMLVCVGTYLSELSIDLKKICSEL